MQLWAFFCSTSLFERWHILLSLSLLAFLLLAIGYYRRSAALAIFGQKNTLFRPLALLGVFVLLCLAQTEPTAFAGTAVETETSTATFFLFDNSLSMNARDTLKGESRMDVAKQLFDLLLKSEEGSWVALGTLNSDVQVIAPLTIDIPITRLLLDEISASTTGTNFLKGFADLFTSFEEGHRPREIILASDGEAVPSMDDQEEHVLLSSLRKEGIPVITIGIGSTKGGIIPEINKQTIPDFRLLAEIAEASGGTFYTIGERSVSALAQEIHATLSENEGGSRIVKVERRLSPYLYLLAALLFLIALRLNPR